MNDYIQANLVLITNSCGFPPVTEKHIHANNWRRLSTYHANYVLLYVSTHTSIVLYMSIYLN